VWSEGYLSPDVVLNSSGIPVAQTRRLMVMETIEGTDRDVGTSTETKQQSRWPTVAVVVLALAVVGLIAWMIFAMRPNSPTAAPPEIVQLMEDYTAAWNAYDADALEALVAPEYRVGEGLGDEGASLETIRTQQWPIDQLAGLQTTYSGPYYAVGGPSEWIVSYEGGVINRGGTDYGTNDLWRVIQIESGELLIAQHFFQGG